MEIGRIEAHNVHRVAMLMHRLKPEFWSLEEAGVQLAAGIGWYMADGPSAQPEGWISCRELPEYRTLQIETMGADDAGRLVLNSRLDGLIRHCVSYGSQHGYVNVSFIIGSRGLSCHGRELGPVWEELQNLHALDRPEYAWLTAGDFRPSGIYPHIYGAQYHGILMIRTIEPV